MRRALKEYYGAESNENFKFHLEEINQRLGMISLRGKLGD